MAPRPFDIFLDDDLLGLRLPAAPGDTPMNVTEDTGPAADQLNIPAVGQVVNNISITATVAGPHLLIGYCLWDGLALNEKGFLTARRNGANFGAPAGGYTAPVAAVQGEAVVVATVAAGAIGDVYQLWVSSSGGTGDILTNNAKLILVTQ